MVEAVFTIEAKKRETSGKETSKKIRQSGLIPAIYYGPGIENINLTVPASSVVKVLRHPRRNNTIVNLKIEGENEPRQVIIKDYQIHPVTRVLLHCDFYDVNDERELVTKVPIKIVGRSEGEKLGGKNNWIVRELRIKTTPSRIPDYIEVNIEGLKVGHKIRISELKLPEGVKAVYKIDQPVIISNAPKRISEQTQAQEEAK